jgi:CheY-like chemotaxis protein
VRGRIQRIVNAGQRASKVVHQVLAYAGRARPDSEPLDLNALVEESVEFQRASFPARVELQLATQAHLPPICADSGQIEQLLSNLVINAAEAIGAASGIVTVRTRAETVTTDEIAREFVGQDVAPGEYIVLEVEDNGSGMTPETLARIFDPFFSMKAAGRGLGLAAIRGIVRAHGGGICVRSQPGVGTLFRVLLPIANEDSLARSCNNQQSEQGASPLNRPALVLVVDDEEDIRDIVQCALESRGMQVLLAENGERGIELFRAQADEIDLVLLDLTMPGLDGRAVLREIHTIRPDARVILSSGYSETDVVSRFGDARLAGFIHKPYTMSVLVESVHQALHQPIGRPTGDNARPVVA